MTLIRDAEVLVELKDFVANTLAEIVEGIVSAQKRVEAHGAHVNPGGLMRNTSSVSNDAIWDNSTNNYARLVSFDVGLTVTEGTTTSAKVGVISGVFNLGAGGNSENKQLAVNRVQFSVPLLFPVSQVPEEARKPKR